MRSLGRGAAGNSPDAHPLQMTLWTDREVGVAWNVRISRRARRMSMRVFPGGRVEVVVPQGAGLPAVERFVARHRDWAERRSKELLQLAPKAADRQPTAVDVRLLDRRWSVDYVPGRRVRAEQVGDSTLRVHCARGHRPPRQPGTGAVAHAPGEPRTCRIACDRSRPRSASTTRA